MKYIVLGREGCSFCTLAVVLLKSLNLPHEYVDINQDPEAKELLETEGHKTVPQVYLEDDERTHIGGYTALATKLSAENRGT